MPVYLPVKNILAPFLSGYDSDGNPAPARLPDAVTQKLPGTGTNVNVIVLQPDGNPISEITTCFSKTGANSATVNEDIAATVTRPLGGSGTATLAGLRALEVLAQ
jgi:hypothetical protein